MNKTVSAIGGLFVILVAVVFIVNFRPGAGAQQVASFIKQGLPGFVKRCAAAFADEELNIQFGFQLGDGV